MDLLLFSGAGVLVRVPEGLGLSRIGTLVAVISPDPSSYRGFRAGWNLHRARHSLVSPTNERQRYRSGKNGYLLAKPASFAASLGRRFSKCSFVIA